MSNDVETLQKVLCLQRRPVLHPRMEVSSGSPSLTTEPDLLLRPHMPLPDGWSMPTVALGTGTMPKERVADAVVTGVEKGEAWRAPQ